ncbi:MAG: PEP-CTERM sorting domain-containing protein, partial [Opitutaceae bacterium]|nr:PEP-CTERM sorting domain-containing protein [Opitutaceae bacterium]
IYADNAVFPANVSGAPSIAGSFGTHLTPTLTTVPLGATLNIRNGFNISGSENWTTHGTLLVGAGSSFTRGSGFLGGNGEIRVLSGGAMTLNGNGNWSGPAGAIIIESGGTLSLGSHANGINRFYSRALTNHGTVLHNANSVGLNNTTVITNHGTWTSTLPGTGQVGGFRTGDGQPNGGEFINHGTFNQAGLNYLDWGSGNTGPGFTNHGTLNVQSGTLAIHSRGTFAGTSVANIASGATLLLRDGTNNLNDGARFQGAGLLSLGDAGSHTLSGTVHADNASFWGGALHGTHTLTGTWNKSGSGGNMGTAGTTTIATGATWNFQASTNLHNRTFINEGGVTRTSGSIVLNANSVIRNHGTWTDGSGAELQSTADRAGLFENHGTFIKTGNNSLDINYYNGPVFSNLGTVDVQQGTLQLHRNLAQHSGSTLTGGTWIVRNGAALHESYASGYTVNQADVTLHGSAIFGSLTTLTDNQGTLRLLDGKTFSATSPFTNSGTLVVGTGSSFATTSTFANSGTLNLLGSFSATGGLTNTGTFGGGGTFTGSLTSGGIISPGESPGLLTITGNLALLSTSQLIIELGGLVEGVSYDHIDVGGTLTFGGELVVNLLDGFSPVSGAAFNLFDAAGFGGSFSSLILPTLTAGLSWDTTALYTSGLLSVTGTAVPEPSTYAILAGLAALAVAVWRRRASKVNP